MGKNENYSNKTKREERERKPRGGLGQKTVVTLPASWGMGGVRGRSKLSVLDSKFRESMMMGEGGKLAEKGKGQQLRNLMKRKLGTGKIRSSREC